MNFTDPNGLKSGDLNYSPSEGTYAIPAQEMVLPRVFEFPRPGFGTYDPFLQPQPLYSTPNGDGKIDWNHAPNGPTPENPNPLGPDWKPKPGSEKDPTGKHFPFVNPKTGEETRFDKDPDGDHWHRLNKDPETNAKKPYLDPNGSPVKREDPAGHIKPNPVPPTLFPDLLA